MRLPLMYLKSPRLFYAHLLLNYINEEGCLHIHLMNLLPHEWSERNKHPDRSIPGHWSEIILIVYPLFLGECTFYEPFLIPLDNTICSMLDLVDPLGSYYWLPFWSWNYIPYIILHDGLVLLHHDILPKLLACCFLKTGRLKINDIYHKSHIWTESL